MKTRLTRRSKELVRIFPFPLFCSCIASSDRNAADAKARAEMAALAKGKGPLNAGTQGIKKSGKK